MNRILIDLGFIEIKWYSVFIFLGLLIGGWISLRESKRFGISEDFMINLFFYLVPFSLIGARLYYVAFNWTHYSQSPMEIIQVWNGGLAIHGAIIAGLLWIIIYSLKYKTNIILMVDMIVVGLLIGQAIGRWGNFFNQEAYGSATTIDFLNKLHLPDFIIKGMYINGIYYHPTFLYESLWCLVGFIIMLFIRRFRYTKLGQLTSFYLIWYGVGRLFIESLRTDSLMLNNFKMAQIISIAMIAIGLIMFILGRKGSVFDNRYNDMGRENEIKY
jgi:phosphatidylglycerol:prolipoprotein diacylglycerol transferase